MKDASGLFDVYAEAYEQALSSAIAPSGESRKYFAEGRVAWLARCLHEGFIGSARIAWRWAESDFGLLNDQLREVLFWSMWLFLGVQTIFSSFFLSMLGISRGTYIGDYDNPREH